MDSEVNLLVNRAENELSISSLLKEVSENDDIKKDFLIEPKFTFYSSVISHAYYSIFYSTKAYLISKRIELPKQGQHQAVYYKFKKLVKEGTINGEMLNIYEELKTRAETLLEIYEIEEQKRTEYTYMTIPQANKEPAENSLKNALFFVSHMKEMIKEVKEDV